MLLRDQVWSGYCMNWPSLTLSTPLRSSAVGKPADEGLVHLPSFTDDQNKSNTYSEPWCDLLTQLVTTVTGPVFREVTGDIRYLYDL